MLELPTVTRMGSDSEPKVFTSLVWSAEYADGPECMPVRHRLLQECAAHIH